jgi:glycosyltransferase involved in cell wall biosynthesis
MRGESGGRLIEGSSGPGQKADLGAQAASDPKHPPCDERRPHSYGDRRIERRMSDLARSGYDLANPAPPLSSGRRLAVLTEMDPWSASTRYRALQYVPRFRSVFSSVTVSLPEDTLPRLPGRIGQVRYFAAHGAQYRRRAVSVSRLVGETEALFVQRGLYPLGPGLVTRSLDRYPGRVVFDLDDAVFRLSPRLASKSRPARWLYGPQQALALMQRADAIIVSTPALAEQLPPGLPEPIVIPTVPDPADFVPVTQSDQLPVTVGWAGTVGGLSYLDPLHDVFAQLLDRGLAKLEVVSSQPWTGPSTFRRWSMDEETLLFSRFAIGIMPLPDTDYTRAKAGFKLLQYMAAGLPVVASPIGINAELVERSGAGLLASSPEEWEAALTELAVDPQLRLSLGSRGRAFVQQYADLDAQGTKIAQLLAA